MELSYVSIEELWRRAASEMRANREAKRKEFDPKILEQPAYKNWVEQIAQRHKDRGLLITEQQLKDMRAKRELRAGDKVRYVGEEVLEKTSSGAYVPRPRGQEGEIITVERHAGGGRVYTFQPKVTKNMLESQTGGEIVRLVTKDWRVFERIV